MFGSVCSTENARVKSLTNFAVYTKFWGHVLLCWSNIKKGYILVPSCM